MANSCNTPRRQTCPPVTLTPPPTPGKHDRSKSELPFTPQKRGTTTRNTEARADNTHAVTVKAMPVTLTEKDRKEIRKEKQRRKKLKRKQDALSEAKRREATSASLLTQEKHYSKPSRDTKPNEPSSHTRAIAPPTPNPVRRTLSPQRSTTSLAPDRAPHTRASHATIARRPDPRVLPAATEFLHGLQHEQSRLCAQSSALEAMRHSLQSSKSALEGKRIVLVEQLLVLTGELCFDLGVAEYALDGDVDEAGQVGGGGGEGLEECLGECKRAVRGMVGVFDEGVERLCKGLRRGDEVRRVMGV
ncbi:hypothetical protein IQ07DRAFT_632818 [Pyrenochaeta sp. DS3sAY3a]|nr:hypothetical protein IQ07DRAFT_632818 [Pyrenochaeta sp. DS3sAY3a]